MSYESASTVGHAGARIRLAAGKAHLLPVSPVPQGMVAGRFSVLSPGTELRHLHDTVTGPAKEAGYMSLGTTASEWVLAPSPHGAAFDPGLGGTLTIPHGAAPHIAALARYQLMAALGLDRVPASVNPMDAVVVGSGPVALGCVLELRRRGAEHTRVLTSRRSAPIGHAPGVECVGEVTAASADLVIDAVGVPERAASLVAHGGVLALLGTPNRDSALPALAVHRSGWTVAGMHELAAVALGRYQRTYTQVVSWLTDQVDQRQATAWCRRVPGHLAPQILQQLEGPERPGEPVIVFEWEP